MPAAGGCGASGTIGGKLYAFSGCGPDVGITKRLDRYDPSTNKWTALAAPASFHFYPAGGAVVNGKFYLVGGSTNTTMPLVLSRTLEAYDPGTGAWTTLAQAPTARYTGTAVGLNGQLYVFGGEDASGASFSTVEVYTPSTNTWRTLSSMPTSRGLPAAAVINGQAYVVGGECCGTGTFTGANEAYTP
jgi:N-acetylneuraminic acid mutarotase